jgi:hypothetical protein
VDPLPCNVEIFIRPKVFVNMNETKAKFVRPVLLRVYYTAINLEWGVKDEEDGSNTSWNTNPKSNAQMINTGFPWLSPNLEIELIYRAFGFIFIGFRVQEGDYW